MAPHALHLFVCLSVCLSSLSLSRFSALSLSLSLSFSPFALSLSHSLSLSTLSLSIPPSVTVSLSLSLLSLSIPPSLSLSRSLPLSISPSLSLIHTRTDTHSKDVFNRMCENGLPSVCATPLACKNKHCPKLSLVPGARQCRDIDLNPASLSLHVHKDQSYERWRDKEEERRTKSDLSAHCNC